MTLQNPIISTKTASTFILGMAVLLGVSVSAQVFAGGKNSLVIDELSKDSSVPKDLTVDGDESGIEQTLEHNFSPDDRARLRKALADYAKSTDPEHNQIEQKRKAMKESVAARFNACDKDSDESLDREETTECLPQIARHFSYVDVDEDELITLEELELAQAKSDERQKAAEAKMEAQKIQEAEAAIKSKSKTKINKQAANTRKRPS
jgi:hypothetical protein